MIDVQLPGLPSLVFLAYLIVILPWGAYRTARRLRGAGPAISRQQYWRSAVLLQAILFTFAWLTGSGFGFRIFAVGAITGYEVFLAAAALALCFVLRALLRWARSEEELPGLAVYQRAPRTRSELAWFHAAVAGASIAEEAAYRGVGFSILWYSLGNPWAAAAIMSVAFALAHWNQGWKSLVTIVALAGVMHTLVALTGTLVLAMAVHAAYDTAAGYLIRRTARGYDNSAAKGTA